MDVWRHLSGFPITCGNMAGSNNYYYYYILSQPCSHFFFILLANFPTIRSTLGWNPGLCYEGMNESNERVHADYLISILFVLYSVWFSSLHINSYPTLNLHYCHPTN